jgi:phosphatidylglycerol lysyltransferase
MTDTIAEAYLPLPIVSPSQSALPEVVSQGVGTYFASRSEMPAEWLSLAEQLVFGHGEAYDSYLILERDRQFFFSADRTGVISFESWRNNIYVVGGLIATKENRGALLREFMNFAQTKNWKLHFLNIMAGDVALFRDHGFELSKTGEEPLVDLRTATWAGKDFAWVRQQENMCAKAGVQFREVEASLLTSEARGSLGRQLKEVSDLHVGQTVYARELGLMVGKFDVEQMFRKRLFVAERDGVVEAFVVSTPSHGGQVWSVETFRRRPESPKGVITFLIVRMARQMKAEGVSYLSLCQCPAVRCNTGSLAESTLITRSMNLWWTTCPWFYDARRLYHFKSRFRPMYRECYIAASPRATFIPMFMFGMKWGVIWPNWLKVPGHMFRRMRKLFHREKLADPAEEKFVRIESLDLPAAGESAAFQVNKPR